MAYLPLIDVPPFYRFMQENLPMEDFKEIMESTITFTEKTQIHEAVNFILHYYCHIRFFSEIGDLDRVKVLVEQKTQYYFEFQHNEFWFPELVCAIDKETLAAIKLATIDPRR